MISTFEAIVLGAIQGLTEFIPISSSAHLVFAQSLFGLSEPPLPFDVFLHLATLLATLIVFRIQVWALLKSIPRLPGFTLHLFQKGHLAIGDDPHAWVVILIFVSTFVTGALGIAFKDQLEATFQSVRFTAIQLAITGVLLFLTRKRVTDAEATDKKRRREGKTETTATLKDAFVIGLAQAISILPGISRSGATLSTALFLGFNRRFAGEFSFLISLPAIAGAVVLELRHGLHFQGIPPWGAAFGFLASFVFGLVTLKALLGWIRSGALSYFAYYCWAVALAAFIYSYRM